MVFKEKSDLEAFILKLLGEQHEIAIPQILQATALPDTPANRRSIQRKLANLIKNGTIQAQGKARARIYVLKKHLTAKPIESQPDETDHAFTFKGVSLSDESRQLLRYVSQPLQMRKPVAYHANFLKSYKPNQTYYLNSSTRQELFTTGSVESVVRPAGTYARNILNRLLIDLSWNSSRLEGNTYSLLETKRLIELGENATGKDVTETQMILNHKNAIEYIVESINESLITAHEVRSIHALLSENLLGDPGASGREREIAVGISGTTYLPLDNPHLLKESFEIFIKKLNLIEDPFEQSFFALVHLSYMQLFEDVNKRTARLVANIPLIKGNLKPLSFIDINQIDYVKSILGVYERNDINLLRDLYVWAYKRSAQQYSAKQTMDEKTIFKLKYRNVIQEIVRKIILENITAQQIIPTIKKLLLELKIPENDSMQLFQILEIEIMSLHDGNIARFRIRPSEFKRWKDNQN